MGGLGVDDVAEAERAGAEDDADEREAEGELVGDHLRGGAEASRAARTCCSSYQPESAMP